MTKPTYTTEELLQLISLIETKDDLMHIDTVFRPEEERYPIKDRCEIKEAFVRKLIKVTNMNAVIIVAIVKCENCGAKNSSFEEKCENCNCQL